MRHLLPFGFYALLSLIFLRPLLPLWGAAIPGGLQDTRLFLWNAWWFHFAIETLKTNPYFTTWLFHPVGSSLVAHDYPLWMNLVTYVAQVAGQNVVGALNTWFLLSWILAGFCSYLLTWEVTRRRAPALVAGIVVMTHSYTLARAMQNWGQFNLYGIALFLWAWLRARRLASRRYYIVAGAALAWTAACHYSFLLYSGVLWAIWLAAELWPWQYQLERRQPAPAFVRQVFLAFAAGFALLAAWIIWKQPGTLEIAGASISVRTPTNALLLMWLMLGAWFLSPWRVGVSRRHVKAVGERLRREAWLLGTALLCLSPLLVETVRLSLQGDYPRQTILWKTHLPGANLFALLSPNPIHALWGSAISKWFLSLGMHPQEQAASLGWVLLAVVILGLWRGSRARTPAPVKPWLVAAGSATVLSMGTYLHLLNWNVWLPLPFYIWRLLPLLGNVRVPERWMALGAVSWAVVLGIALVQLARRKGWSLNRLCLLIGALILFENWPGIPLGRPSANNPIYQKLRTLPRGGVLPLPLYVGDSSVGAGHAPGIRAWENLGTQIYHQQPLVGGYIGRISRKLIDDYRNDPLTGRLLALEEGKPVSAEPLSRADACAALRDLAISYVVFYKNELPPAAEHFLFNSVPLQQELEADGTVLFSSRCP